MNYYDIIVDMKTGKTSQFIILQKRKLVTSYKVKLRITLSPTKCVFFLFW